MRFSSRPTHNHGILVLFEAIAIPVSILATIVVLLVGSGAHDVLQYAGEFAGAGDTALELGTIAIALLVGLVLVSGGGLAVIGYRRAFEAMFEDVRPLPTMIVPLIGVVVPAGYVVATTGAPTLPMWAFVIVTVSAYALAFRTIAVESLLEDRGRVSVLVGAVTAIPAITAIVTLASDVLAPGRGAAVQPLMAVVTESGIQIGHPVLVVVPLLVAATYGVLVVKERDEIVPRSTAQVGIGERFADVVQSVRIGELLGRSSEPTTQRAPETSADSSVVRPQFSDDSSRARAPASKRRAVVPSSPSDRGRNAKSSDRGSSNTNDARDPSGKSHSAGSNSSSCEQRDGAEKRSSDAPSTERSGSGDTPSTGGSGSDTRIFVDDFDEHGQESNPAGGCPDCEKTIPSDGVYKFCPFCGTEL